MAEKYPSLELRPAKVKGPELRSGGSSKRPDQPCSSSSLQSKRSRENSDIGDNPVKTTLQEQYAYLRENLSVDNELSAKLFGWKPKLLDKPTFAEIRALNEHGKPYEAFQKWYEFAESGYTEERLRVFCECLEVVGEDAKPKLIEVAKKIRRKPLRVYGFDEESIQSYVREFFQAKPEEGQKMLDELRSRPDLMGGAYIPMNLFIFCSIYAGHEFPPTMTQYYKQFICNVITKECKKSGIPCRVDKNLNNLSDDVEGLLDSLSSLAYEGMIKTPPTFVFDEDDIRRAFPALQPEALIEESLFKGLLHQHSSTVGYLTSSTFKFSHTTNQEFFCAYHIAQLSDDEQLLFVQENFTNIKFSMVIRFYAGLTGLSSPEVDSFLCHPHPQPHASYSQSSVHSLSLPSVCTNDDPRLLYLFHSLYESQNSDLTREIVQHLNQSQFLLHLTPDDTLAIAHCLSKCTHLRDLRFTRRLDPLCLPHVFSILKANVYLQRYLSEVDHLSSADASDLISVTSVERLYLGVRVTTLSALSAIFASTTIVYLTLRVEELITDIDNEQSKSELIRSVAENTTLRKLDLTGKSYFMIPVLHGVAGNTTIEDLDVGGDDDAAEELAATCVANMKLKRVTMDFISPLPVMKSLATRQVPLEEFGIGLSSSWVERVLSEDELKEMEKYAAEMKVVKVTFNVENNLSGCDAICSGLGRNKVLKHVTLHHVPEEKIEFVKSKLSSIKTVTVE